MVSGAPSIGSQSQHFQQVPSCNERHRTQQSNRLDHGWWQIIWQSPRPEVTRASLSVANAFPAYATVGLIVSNIQLFGMGSVALFTEIPNVGLGLRFRKGKSNPGAQLRGFNFVRIMIRIQDAGVMGTLQIFQAPVPQLFKVCITAEGRTPRGLPLSQAVKGGAIVEGIAGQRRVLGNTEASRIPLHNGGAGAV